MKLLSFTIDDEISELSVRMKQLARAFMLSKLVIVLLVDKCQIAKSV